MRNDARENGHTKATTMSFDDHAIDKRGRETMREAHVNAVAVTTGQMVARFAFDKRGNHGEAHLAEVDVASLIALGVKQALAEVATVHGTIANGWTPDTFGGSTAIAGLVGELAMFHARAHRDDSAYYFARLAAREALQFFYRMDKKQKDGKAFELYQVQA